MNCKACDHIHAPQGGHCYMFKNKPVTACGQHTGRREVLLGSTDTSVNQKNRLLTRKEKEKSLADFHTM